MTQCSRVQGHRGQSSSTPRTDGLIRLLPFCFAAGRVTSLHFCRLPATALFTASFFASIPFFGPHQACPTLPHSLRAWPCTEPATLHSLTHTPPIPCSMPSLRSYCVCCQMLGSATHLCLSVCTQSGIALPRLDAMRPSCPAAAC